MRNEANLTVMNATTAVAFSTGVVYLCGIQVHTALTGTMVVTGFKDDAGVAASITFPAASVGALIPMGCKIRAVDLTITMSNAADKLKAVVAWSGS